MNVLKEGGGFLCKVFPGAEITELRQEIKKHFKFLKTIIPDATRKSSTEIYLVGLCCVKREA
jgi:23S rRNA (uridine2552-2'-O)-methyltransferase